MTGVTEDGSFEDYCIFSISQTVTKLQDVKFGSGYDLTNQYASIVYVDKVLTYSSQTYIIVNDATSSLLLTTGDTCINIPEENKVYKMFYSLSHKSNELYAGTLNYFEEITDVPIGKLTTVKRYKNISTNPIAPQLINIFASQVSGLISDTALGKFFYRVGDKEVLLSNIKVYNPATQTTDNCEIGQYLTLDGVLLPFASYRSEYRFIFVPTDKNVLASYSLSFNLQNGGGYKIIETTTAIVGEQVLFPEVPLEEHQTLTPWYTNPINPIEYDFTAIPESGNPISVFARIETTDKTFVRFYVGDRVYHSESGYTDGSFTVNAPKTNPISYNKVFVGWSAVEGDSTSIVTFPQTVTSKTFYYAIFRDLQIVTVTFVDSISDKTLFETQTVEGSKLNDFPTQPTSPNVIFDGWSYDKNENVPFDFDDVINESLTIYARYRSPKAFRVQFELINGTKFEPFYVNEGNYIPQDKVPDVNAILGNEFDFLYWRVIQASWNRKFFVESETVKEDLNLLAVTESPFIFSNTNVMSQLHLSYTKNVTEEETTYSLLSASIHIGCRMKAQDLFDSNPGSIDILYGTNKTFAKADAETGATFTDFSSRLDALYQAVLVKDYAGDLGYGYSNLGLRYVHAEMANVDGYGNQDEAGEYTQFGITISNININNIDTKIFMAVYTKFGYGFNEYNTYIVNSEDGMSLRDICLRYITMPNASEVLGDHYGVIEYLANYSSSNN